MSYKAKRLTETPVRYAWIGELEKLREENRKLNEQVVKLTIALDSAVNSLRAARPRLAAQLERDFNEMKKKCSEQEMPFS